MIGRKRIGRYEVSDDFLNVEGPAPFSQENNKIVQSSAQGYRQVDLQPLSPLPFPRPVMDWGFRGLGRTWVIV